MQIGSGNQYTVRIMIPLATRKPSAHRNKSGCHMNVRIRGQELHTRSSKIHGHRSRQTASCHQSLNPNESQRCKGQRRGRPCHAKEISKNNMRDPNCKTVPLRRNPKGFFATLVGFELITYRLGLGDNQEWPAVIASLKVRRPRSLFLNLSGKDILH